MTAVFLCVDQTWRHAEKDNRSQVIDLSFVQGVFAPLSGVIRVDDATGAGPPEAIPSCNPAALFARGTRSSSAGRGPSPGFLGSEPSRLDFCCLVRSRALNAFDSSCMHPTTWAFISFKRPSDSEVFHLREVDTVRISARGHICLDSSRTYMGDLLPAKLPEPQPRIPFVCEHHQRQEERRPFRGMSRRGATFQHTRILSRQRASGLKLGTSNCHNEKSNQHETSVWPFLFHRFPFPVFQCFHISQFLPFSFSHIIPFIMFSVFVTCSFTFILMFFMLLLSCPSICVFCFQNFQEQSHIFHLFFPFSNPFSVSPPPFFLSLKVSWPCRGYLPCGLPKSISTTKNPKSNMCFTSLSPRFLSHVMFSLVFLLFENVAACALVLFVSFFHAFMFLHLSFI